LASFRGRTNKAIGRKPCPSMIIPTVFKLASFRVFVATNQNNNHLAGFMCLGGVAYCSEIRLARHVIASLRDILGGGFAV